MLSVSLLAVALASCGLWPLSKPATASSKGSLRTVPHVDLARYMGDWRIIADIPHRAEKECVDSIESYALRPDGKIETWFTYRKKSFDAPQKTIKAVAEIMNKETNAEWKGKLFGLHEAQYFVIDLDPYYQWTVVGHPSRDYGWIMARKQSLPAVTYETILDRVAAQGYDPGRFLKVPQLSDQLPPPQ